ncbi:hypothetical protein P7C73_g1929, partial [Tremellales sp. Uapishka_1]
MKTILDVPNNTHPQWWRDPGLRKLNALLAIVQIGTVVAGYDGSLMNGFFSIADFLSDMGNPDANIQGLLIASISLGTIIGVLFCGLWADLRGRVEPQKVGCIIIIVGALIQTFAIGPWKLFGARILVGFGSGIVLVIGSIHTIELAHPRQAAQHAAFFSANYYIGSIIAWLTFGCLYINSNWNWRLPALFQCAPSVIQFIGMFFVPESPRWLLSVGRDEEAFAILFRYHANGETQDEMVLMEVAEIKASIEVAIQNKSNSVKDIFKTPGNRKRFVILAYVGLILQWAGNGIIGYYLAPILVTVGITNPTQQQGINGGLQIWNYIWAVLGCLVVTRVTRRTQWLTSFVGMLISYTIFTALSAVYASNGSKSVGSASIAFLFLFNASYAIAATSLAYLYLLEILPQGLRAQGMVIYIVIDYAAIFFNQYVNPVAFAALAWKYYILYIAILAVSVVFIWWYFPETFGLTVEEAAMVCDGPDALLKMSSDARAQTEVPEAGLDDKDLKGDGPVTTILEA